jgi:poly(A) polymerase
VTALPMSKSELPSLAGAPWLSDMPLQMVMATLAREGEVRVVGGAVRNALLALPVADVDLATTLLPTSVMRICDAAGFGVHPTGFAHGTITVTHDARAFEVTTLRRDVSTDGRRAVVAFTTNWAEDAARRDFTMNALYCDAHGKIYDYTAGYEDLLARRIKFVGNPIQRIREDYLRILRFFRFHASFGKSTPDKVALAACVKEKRGLMSLSAERIRQEMMKLLVAPRAVETLKVMARHRILKDILPHTEEWRVLKRLPDDAILRLLVLAKQPEALQDRLRLSNADAERLVRMIGLPDVSPALLDAERRRILYQLGKARWRDAVQLSRARSRSNKGDWQGMLDLAEQWPAPTFPLKGSDLITAGMTSGPRLGQVLTALEDWWVASDFTSSKQELLGRLSRYKD